MRITVFVNLRPTEEAVRKYGILAYWTNPQDVIVATAHRFREKNPDMRLVRGHQVATFTWKLVFEKLEDA